MKYLLVVLCMMVTLSPVYAQSVCNQDDFLTDVQEEYLADHPQLYAYFAELYITKKSPHQIGVEYQIPDIKNLQFLNELASIGIIQKLEENDLSSPVNFLVYGVSRFKKAGALQKKLSHQMLKEYYKKMEKELTEGTVKFASAGLWITERQHEAYLKELNDLENKYIEISIQNRKNSVSNAHRVSELIVLIPNWEPELFSLTREDP